jgi:2OG-Fe(II) oxygenase superfamily
MGKAGKARKRARRDKEVGSCIDVDSPAAAASETEQSALLKESDVATTESTLRRLLESPELLLRSSQARVIRRQAFAIVEALGASSSTCAKSVTGKIGDALHDGRWNDAVTLLQQLVQERDNHGHRSDTGAMPFLPPPPPLGALQRWIRDLYETASSRTDMAKTVETSCTLLHLILRSIGQTPVGNEDDESELEGPMKVFPMWFSIPRRSTTLLEQDDDDDDDDKLLSGLEVEAVAVESAWKDGMTLWTCHSLAVLDRISDSTTRAASPVVRCDVPFVPGAFVMHDAVSAVECRRILSVAHKMGFTKEASYSTSGESSSPAADGVVWIVNDGTLAELFARVSPLLPPILCGGKLVGLNARWRIYHYRVGAVYRPHIDGAWTGSGIVDGVYVKDVYKNANVTSRLTFLFYLNDDFDDGATTFYAPSHELNCISARSVAPIQGSILCFPHGHGVDNVGLVHEGSAVTRGSKYVMRSDVLYDVPAGSRTDTSI